MTKFCVFWVSVYSEWKCNGVGEKKGWWGNLTCDLEQFFHLTSIENCKHQAVNVCVWAPCCCLKIKLDSSAMRNTTDVIIQHCHVLTLLWNRRDKHSSVFSHGVRGEGTTSIYTLLCMQLILERWGAFWRMTWILFFKNSFCWNPWIRSGLCANKPGRPNSKSSKEYLVLHTQKENDKERNCTRVGLTVTVGWQRLKLLLFVMSLLT